MKNIEEIIKDFPPERRARIEAKTAELIALCSDFARNFVKDVRVTNDDTDVI